MRQRQAQARFLCLHLGSKALIVNNAGGDPDPTDEPPMCISSSEDCREQLFTQLHADAIVAAMA